MERSLKLAIPLTGRATVVPLHAAPVGLEARLIVILPVNELSMPPRESRVTTLTGGVIIWPTLAEFGCTKKPKTGGAWLVLPLPPAMPMRPEPVPPKQPLITRGTSVRVRLECAIRIVLPTHT